MNQLTMADVMANQQYEQERASIRARVIALKKKRRVSLGPRVTVVFENRETMRFQVQEMLRIEHIEDPEKIQQEIDVYNDLLPVGQSIGATLLIELVQTDDMPEVLRQMSGVEETISLEYGNFRVPAAAEEGRSTDEKTSSVHYLTFTFGNAERDGLMEHADAVELVSGHQGYQYRTRLSRDTVASLVSDLI